MKKILSVLFVFLMFVTLCGCDEKQQEITSEEPKIEVQEEIKEEPVVESEQTKEVKEEVTEVVSDPKVEPKEEIKEEVKEEPATAVIDPYGYLGKSESEFTNALSNLGFTNVVKIDTVYSDYPEGTICYYLPDGKQELTTKISYKVSKGPKSVEQKTVKEQPVEEQPVIQEEKPKEKAYIVSDVTERIYEGDNNLGYVYRVVTFSDGVVNSDRYPVNIHRAQNEDGSWYSYATEEDWQSTENFVRNEDLSYHS